MKQHAGFTMIEVAVVLVIIGLIVGGILTGRSLISAAETKAVISEIDAYNTAITQFRERFTAWPGDMVDATAIFGVGPANGNGNDQVQNNGESLAAWDHLQRGGYIQLDIAGGAQLPPSSQQPAEYLLQWVAAANENRLTLGTRNGPATTLTNSAVTQATANTVDQKTDDGVPAAGRIIGTNGADAPAGMLCLNGAAYNMNPAQESRSCVLALRIPQN